MHNVFHNGFLIRLTTQRDRDRVLPRLFRNALSESIAVLAPPRPGSLFYVAPTARRYFQRVELTEPHRIIGVYRNTGDPMALIEALMEDLRDAAARLA